MDQEILQIVVLFLSSCGNNAALFRQARYRASSIGLLAIE